MFFKIVIVFSSFLLACQAQAIQPSVSPMRCDGLSRWSLADIMDKTENKECAMSKLAALEKTSSLEQRLDTLQSCTCNLINKNFAWQSMINTNVESLFESIFSVVRERRHMQSPVDYLDFLHHQVMFFAKADMGEVAVKLQDYFKRYHTSNGLLPEDDFPIKLISTTKTRDKDAKAAAALAETCADVATDFGPFHGYLKQLNKLAKNPTFHYRASLHDENLVKLVVVSEVCGRLMSLGNK